MVYYLLNANLKIKVKNSALESFYDDSIWGVHSFLRRVFLNLIVKRTQCHTHTTMR